MDFQLNPNWLCHRVSDSNVNGADTKQILVYRICICFLLPNTNMNKDIARILNLLFILEGKKKKGIWIWIDPDIMWIILIVKKWYQFLITIYTNEKELLNVFRHRKMTLFYMLSYVVLRIWCYLDIWIYLRYG